MSWSSRSRSRSHGTRSLERVTPPRPRSVQRLAACALVLGLLSAGCASEPGPAAAPESAPGVSTAPSGSPSQPAARRAPVPDLDVRGYVALGDSYTAAPFVPPTERESGCLRSSSNYPRLVAEAIEPVRFRDVSCTGADATAMIGAQPTVTGGVNLPQFDAIDRRTDLVTVGLGGNDFGVFSELLAGCVERAPAAPDGAPCREAHRRGGEDQLLASLEQTRERLVSVLRGIEDRAAPDARVVLVGYPVLVPEAGTCPERLPLAEDDYDYVRTVNLALNDALEAAAEEAGATFVDVGAASDGHDICAEDPWVNGDDHDEARALAYHPFAEEQQAVADLVLRALTRDASRGD